MRIAQAGHSVKEITGRSLTVDYTNADDPKLSTMASEETDRVKTVHGFNNGQVDALVINVAGSTGISLHASERYKDQRQRHMIVAQPAQDINVFMQMLGRIHRTGQVRLPKYTILNTDLPAEKRPTALLSKKMKSLNANTSSNTESATSVKAVDMLNKYGDEKVHAYMLENPELADAMGVEVDPEPTQDFARAVTGRLALMPVDVQRAFYEDVEQQYSDYIEYLNATNQNELEPRTFDYDAKETKSQVIFQGADKSSPFGEDAIYGEYSIKAQGKPLTPDEVRGAINEHLGGASAAQKVHDTVAELDEKFKAYRDTLEDSSPQYIQAGVVAETGRDWLRRDPIGSTLRIEINGDIYNAVVVNVRNTHKSTGNPFALSKFQVTLATNGEMRTISVPATQLEKITVTRLWEQPEDLFRVISHEFRSQAKILTGNLLAAYGEIQGTRGTIINFTKADGATEQGILLPKKFEPKEAFRGDYRIPAPEQAARFLLKSQSPQIEEDGIGSRDGDVHVVRDGRSLVIVTPRSKARGAKYFLDHKLIDIVGDFVSKSGMMRATIPHGKEAAALGRIMDKSALYAPAELAEEAQGYGDQAPQRRTDPTATVGFLGTQYADKLLKEGAAAGKKFWDADVAPNMVKLGGGAKEAGAQIAHFLYPRLGANADAQDILSRARGKLESHLFTLEHLDGGLEKFFDKMSREAQLAFIDRYKLGVGQPDNRLQQIEQIMRAIDDRSLQAAQQFKPNLAAKENHFRVIWRVIPGGKTAGGKSAQFTGAKRPWQGDKGFMKRATLDTISEGINAGGEPVTTNPWKLFTLAQASMMKFVAAQQAWENAKGLGLRKFVKRGEQAPDGWVKINDRIADVYFPEQALSVDVNALPVQKIGPKSNKKDFVAKEDLDTHTILRNTGSWYAEPGFGRLLNNYLSEDHLRHSAVGSALLFAKNLSTAVELSLSPFHAIFETLEAVGSQFGLGVQRAWNNGIRLGDGAELTQGLKEIANSVAAPYLLSRTGGNVLRYAEDPAQFFQTPRGKAFARQYPDAVGAMQELFNGGLTWGVQRDFRFDPQKSMIEAAKEGNYVGAALRAIPWVNSVLMKPLFEAYIPRLKWGLALGLYSEQLVENAEALANGDMTKTEIARKVADTVENRFGEMNFNNVYWNNTFKSVLQLAFRSVTWKLGNWRGAGSAMGPEMLNSFRDPLAAMKRDWQQGGGYERRKYLPRVGMNQGWLLGMLFTTAVLGTVAAKFWNHKWPWEMVAEDREEGYSFPGALALEMVHPRTGRVNDHTGKPERISLPTGLRDFEHAVHDLPGYAKNSMSSFAVHAWQTLENRDAFKNYVYDPNGSAYQKLAEIFAYNLPKPISFENLKDKYGAQDTTSKALKMAGLGNASSSLDYSPAEQRMRSQHTHDPLTPEQVKERDQEHMHPTPKELHKQLKARNLPYVERLFKGLSYAQAREVYNSPDTTDHERQLLHKMMREKRQRYLKQSR
jgi:hypothetical protein